MKKALFGIALSICCIASAQSQAALAPAHNPSEFNQEKMGIENEKIYLISSFDIHDYLTCYDFYGSRIWYVQFSEKIISWKKVNHMIFVFSKDRLGDGTTLTCLDAWTGSIMWQRP